MRDFAISILTVQKSARSATLAVDVQKKTIAAMHPGDPCFPFACAMLCVMEQSAAIAEMNLVFYTEGQHYASP